MSSQALPAPNRPALVSRIGVHDQVLFALVLAAVVAALSSGFIAVAPNRLISGQPISLWSATDPKFAAGMVVVAGLLLAVSLSPPRRAVYGIAVTLASAWLLLAFAALGNAAHTLAAGASAVVRISAGTSFWVIAGCAALGVVDALQRLRAGPMLMAATLAVLCSGTVLLALGGAFDQLSIAREYATRHALFVAALSRHVALVAGSVGPALLIGFPLGLLATRRPGFQGPLFATLNLLQTVPSIALFGLLIVPLSALAAAVPRLASMGVGGIGPTPAIIALVLYALLPIVRNTTTGISGVDPAVIDAARGMGLTPRQIFCRIEFPLALPMLLVGLRIVTVQTIGLTVVAALIGAGGLGTFVFEGLGQYALDLVLLGALPAIGLSLAADFVLHMVSALLLRARPG